MNNEDFYALQKKYVGNHRLKRAKAVKLYCKEQCCAGDMLSWQNCSFTACFLYKFRFGRELQGNQTSFKKTRKNTHISGNLGVIEADQTPISEVKT